MSHGDDTERAAVAARVEHWRACVRHLAGESAAITVDELRGVGPMAVLDVEPGNPRAARLSLVISARELILQLGQHGCRWELDGGEADISFAERVIDAAIAGRAEELVGTLRFAVRVTSPDGTTEESVRFDGLLTPSRRWLRRGAWTRFEPYVPR